jgi:hypothetical protein
LASHRINQTRLRQRAAKGIDDALEYALVSLARQGGWSEVDIRRALGRAPRAARRRGAPRKYNDEVMRTLVVLIASGVSDREAARRVATKLGVSPLYLNNVADHLRRQVRRRWPLFVDVCVMSANKFYPATVGTVAHLSQDYPFRNENR